MQAWIDEDGLTEKPTAGALLVKSTGDPEGWRSGGGGRRVCRRRMPVPGEEFCKFVGRVVGDAAEGVGEPSLRIDAVSRAVVISV